jgi:hypothetical protein
MASRFAETLAKARQVVHDHLSFAAVYQENDAADPVELSVRRHSKIALSGDLDGQGYTEILEGVNRLVFNKPELAEKSVTLVEGGVIKVTSSGERFVLCVKEKVRGVVEESWQVGPL